MKTNIHYFKIGLFIVICLIGLIVGIVAISADAFTQDAIQVETYLDESVQGLSVGSPVMRRGVDIGRVDKITFVPQVYSMEECADEMKLYSRYVYVLMSIKKNNLISETLNEEQLHMFVNSQIERGLRFKLSFQGITGIAFMEADYVDPDRNPPMDIVWKPQNLYIPSSPSFVTNFTQAIDNVFQRLEKVDIEGISNKMVLTLDTLQREIENAHISEFREHAVTLMDEISNSNKQIQGVIDDFRKTKTLDKMPAAITQFEASFKELETSISEIRGLVSDFRKSETLDTIPTAVRQFEQAFTQIEDTVKGLDYMLSRYDVDADRIIYNVKVISENLKELTDELKAHPSLLLFSKPQPKSEVIK